MWDLRRSAEIRFFHFFGKKSFPPFFPFPFRRRAPAPPFPLPPFFSFRCRRRANVFCTCVLLATRIATSRLPRNSLWLRYGQYTAYTVITVFNAQNARCLKFWWSSCRGSMIGYFYVCNRPPWKTCVQRWFAIAGELESYRTQVLVYAEGLAARVSWSPPRFERRTVRWMLLQCLWFFFET